MQKDRFKEMKQYVQEHKSIRKQLIDFGILVLNTKINDDRKTIQELESMPSDEIH
jgi:hypothetical protein